MVVMGERKEEDGKRKRRGEKTWKSERGEKTWKSEREKDFDSNLESLSAGTNLGSSFAHRPMFCSYNSTTHSVH